MKFRIISAGPGALHAYEWGSGPRLLLAFHGYSNNAGLFALLGAKLAADFTTVALDLPGHGATKWPAGKLLTQKIMVEVAENLCVEKGVEQCAVTAFSLGGRVALSLFAGKPNLVSQMVLAAPDGLSANWLQALALNTGLGEMFSTNLLENPGRYGKVLDMLLKRGLLPKGRHQFLQYHLNNQSSVRRVQEALLPLRKLTPSVSQLRSAISKNNTPVHLLMGTADNVIPIAQGTAFVKDLPSATLHALSKNHRLFDAGTVAQIAALLLQNP